MRNKDDKNIEELLDILRNEYKTREKNTVFSNSEEKLICRIKEKIALENKRNEATGKKNKNGNANRGFLFRYAAVFAVSFLTIMTIVFVKNDKGDGVMAQNAKSFLNVEKFEPEEMMIQEGNNVVANKPMLAMAEGGTVSEENAMDKGEISLMSLEKTENSGMSSSNLEHGAAKQIHADSLPMKKAEVAPAAASTPTATSSRRMVASVQAKEKSVKSKLAQFQEEDNSVLIADADIGSGSNTTENASMNKKNDVSVNSLRSNVAIAAEEKEAKADRIVLPPGRKIIPWPPYHPPIIVVPPRVPAGNEHLEPIMVTQGEANVRVMGELAEVVYEFTVKNPNGRVLEGELQLPLPDGATITELALDMDNVMVEAALVPKERAREVFEAVERQGVDPAMVEHVGGNTYRTRIYPINANGTRRVRLTFVTKVLNLENNPVLVLPMRFENKLEKFQLRIEIADQDILPQTEEHSAFSNLNFQNWRNVLLAERTLTDVALPEDLRLSLAKKENFRNNSPFHLQKCDNNLWFSYSSLNTQQGKQKSQPNLERLNLVWDASGSCANHDHVLELERIADWLKGSNCEIHLYFLNNKLNEHGVYHNPDDLLKQLKDVPYDGGTNLSALIPLLSQKTPLLLVSDGMDNFGSGIPSEQKIESPLSVLNTSSTAATLYLKGLVSRAPSGCMVNLAEGEGNGKKFAELFFSEFHTKAPVVSIDGRMIAMNQIAWEQNGERRFVIGRISPDAKRIFIDEKEFDLTKTSVTEGNLLKTRFGQLRLAELEQNPKAKREEYLALGDEYHLVTPYSSLLVLDSVEQYIRYEIRPPEHKLDWCKVFDTAMAEKAKLKNGQKKETKNLDEVLTRYQREVMDWYEGKVRVSQRYVGAVELQGRAAYSRTASANGTIHLDSVMPMGGNTVRAARQRESAKLTMDSVAREEAFAPTSSEVGQAKKELSKASSAEKSIQMKAWKPDADYLKKLEEETGDTYSLYLKFRKGNAQSAGFFMDCAQFFFEHDKKEIALTVLSNLAEFELENKFLLRILGYKLRFFGVYDEAERVFRKVLELAPEEAQSYRDLALVLADQSKWQEAADMHLYIIGHSFDNRFPNIDLIAITELNDVILKAKRNNVEVKNVDTRLIQPLKTDLRIVIGWDTDMSDMDLHVVDPTNETCFYGHRYTVNGGRISNDFTQGYGPEEFMVKEALNGRYVIKSHYYGSHAQKIIGPVTVYAEVITDFGTENEKKQTLTFRLPMRDALVEIGGIDIKNGREPKTELPPKPPKKEDPIVLHSNPGASSAQTDSSDLPSVERIYQLRANETLEDVSQKFYQDTNHVEQIRNANSDKVVNGRIPTGTLLVIP